MKVLFALLLTVTLWLKVSANIANCDEYCQRLGYGGGVCEGTAPFCDGECAKGTIDVGTCSSGCIFGSHRCCCSSGPRAALDSFVKGDKGDTDPAHAIEQVSEHLGMDPSIVGGHFIACHGNNECLKSALPGINKCWWACSASACANGGTLVCEACRAMCPPEDIKNCMKQCDDRDGKVEIGREL